MSPPPDILTGRTPVTSSDPRLRLADAHEAVERLLERLRSCPGPSEPRSWRRARQRLQRLLHIERRLLQAVARRHQLEPLPALLDPRRAGHQTELRSLLVSADGRAGVRAPWHQVTRDLQDFLSWTFITVEQAALAG